MSRKRRRYRHLCNRRIPHATIKASRTLRYHLEHVKVMIGAVSFDRDETDIAVAKRISLRRQPRDRVKQGLESADLQTRVVIEPEVKSLDQPTLIDIRLFESAWWQAQVMRIRQEKVDLRYLLLAEKLQQVAWWRPRVDHSDHARKDIGRTPQELQCSISLLET